MVILSSSPVALQRLINLHVAALRRISLSFNPEKCTFFNIIVERKRKRWLWSAIPFLYIEENLIPSLHTLDSYRYLGVCFGYQCDPKDYLTLFRSKLELIRTSPLRPQQKLWAIQTKVIPSSYHPLVLGGYSHKVLKDADVVVRGILKRILHLPKDTPTSFFHAAHADGGLGISSMYIKVSLMRKNRIENLANENYPLFNRLIHSKFVTTFLDKFIFPKISGIPITSSSSAPSCLGQNFTFFG